MSAWGGFTEDELKRLNNAACNNREAKSSLKEASLNRPTNRRAMRPVQNVDKLTRELPAEQKLSVSNPKILPGESIKSIRDAESSRSVPPVEEKDSKLASTGTGVQTNQKIQDDSTKLDVNENKDEDVQFTIDESSILEIEMQNLEKFRKRQKEMEEMNKKRKAMLASAILEKEKRAKAETKKLVEIKSELSHIDQLVVSDISIIRDRIEECSRTYLLAQKRYELAEKEFVEAKIDLHKKKESKERLTEHLCTVIHQNELRKAAKLNELMAKLEMAEKEEIEEEFDASHVVPAILALEQSCIQNIRHSVSDESKRSDVVLADGSEIQTESVKLERSGENQVEDVAKKENNG